MRLFTIDADYKVELNKEWIQLIPEFAELLRRDKGSEGDYRGDKKLKARKEFTFIYFDLDFTSPIREWEAFERREEAMRYAGLQEKDIDDKVMTAHRIYDKLLLGCSRSLKTLKAVEKSLDQLDEYFENIDFNEKDKKGELLHNAGQYLTNIEKLGKAYSAVEAFRKRVAEELKEGSSIRGAAILGRKEAQKRETWTEGSSSAGGHINFEVIGRAIAGDDDEEDK